MSLKRCQCCGRIIAEPAINNPDWCVGCGLDAQVRARIISQGRDPSVWGPAAVGEQPTTRKRKFNMRIEMDDSTSILGSITAVAAALVMVVIYVSSCTVKNNAIDQAEKTKRLEMMTHRTITNAAVSITIDTN